MQILIMEKGIYVRNMLFFKKKKKQKEVRFINFKSFKVFLTQIFYCIPIILILKDNLSSGFFYCQKI